jgi:general secretion pathway protein G
MKNQQSKQAFTMVELIFVIVIVGILASVAVPRLAATRDDAEISKAKVLVASIRNALTMERQKRILRGEFSPITAVGGATNVFGNFDNNSSQPSVLEYPIASNANDAHWEFVSGGTYRYHGGPIGNVDFNVTSGKFICDTTLTGCQQLTN